MKKTKFNLDMLMHLHHIDMLNINGYKELVRMLHIALMEEMCKTIVKKDETVTRPKLKKK